MNKLYRIRTYFIYAVIYSIIGWIYEVLYFLIKNHEFINRGYLYGPYLPIYGIGSILIILIFKNYMINNNYRKVLIIFFTSMILLMSLEFSTHFLFDKLFGIYLWNYKQSFLNIDGRTSFIAGIFFGISGIFLIYYINPFFNKIFNKINDKFKNIVFLILIVILLGDFLIKIAN